MRPNGELRMSCHGCRLACVISWMTRPLVPSLSPCTIWRGPGVPETPQGRCIATAGKEHTESLAVQYNDNEASAKTNPLEHFHVP